METEKVTMLRYRGSKLSKVKKLDIFPKVEETFKETSSVGGTCKVIEIYDFLIELFMHFPVSIISFVIIIVLVYSEVNYYLNSKFIFKFSPDVDFDEKLKINVDITVAMPCHSKYNVLYLN